MLPWQTWQTYVSLTNKSKYNLNLERKNINTDYNNNYNNKGSGPWAAHYTFGCVWSNFNNSMVSKLDDSFVVSRSQRLWRCLEAMLLSRSHVVLHVPKSKWLWARLLRGSKPTSQGTLLPTQRNTGNHFFSVTVAKKFLNTQECSLDCSIKKTLALFTNIQNKSLIGIKILHLNASVRRFCSDMVNSEFSSKQSGVHVLTCFDHVILVGVKRHVIRGPLEKKS